MKLSACNLASLLALVLGAASVAVSGVAGELNQAALPKVKHAATTVESLSDHHAHADAGL